MCYCDFLNLTFIHARLWCHWPSDGGLVGGGRLRVLLHPAHVLLQPAYADTSRWSRRGAHDVGYAKRSWSPGGTLSLFTARFSMFSSGRIGAPHVPGAAGGNSWHWFSRSFMPGQLGLCVASVSSVMLSAPRWWTSIVTLMLGPFAPLDAFPRCMMARRPKSPMPWVFFSASDRIRPSLSNRYFTFSWSRYSLSHYIADLLQNRRNRLVATRLPVSRFHQLSPKASRPALLLHPCLVLLGC